MTINFRATTRASAPYLCVAALQLLLLYPLHTTMDLPLWDESHYMGSGEVFLHGGTLGPVSGSPLYILLYSLFLKMFGTMNSVFYMQYFVKVCVSVLLLLFLVERLRCRPLALLLTLIWVASAINIWETVLVYHVALGIFLLALVFSNKHRVLTLLLLFACALTRLEYLFPALAYGAYLTLTAIRRRRDARSELHSFNAAVTLPRLLGVALAATLSYAVINVDGWNPGGEKTWFAFSQHYSRHEVEAGRYSLNPYIDSNIVIAGDFPGADSLTEAFRVNPQAFAKHLLRNVAGLPKACVTFALPFTYLRKTFALLYGALLGFALMIILYAAVNERRQFAGRLFHVISEKRDILYLTLMSITALIPCTFVYPLPHYTLITAPFCLLWAGLVCLHVLRVINSPTFTRAALRTLNALFILSILVVTKPYAGQGRERPVYEQVAQLIEVWPEGRVKLLGVGASSYGYYLGSQKVLPVELLATVAGGKMESGGGDLRALIERYHPDAILINGSLMNSKNFDAGSLEILHSERWVECPLGSDSIYFLKEKFKKCR